MKFGLNLYSIRNLIKTEDEFVETSKKLKEMGYSFLQYSGAPIDVKRMKREIEEVGLPIILTHSPADRILNDTDELIKEHKSIGCYNIGLGSAMGENGNNAQSFKEQIDKYELVAEKMEKQGMKFFYHNHMHEFMKDENGELLFDYMIKNAPHFNFTLDTYWVVRGGVDFYDLVKKLKGRISCVHLKDNKVIYSEKSEIEGYNIANEICPCGDGTLDFKKMYVALKEAGAEYFIVEQDNAALKEDTLNQVKRSIDYLNKIFN